MGGLCCSFVDDDADANESNNYGALHQSSAIAQLMRGAMVQVCRARARPACAQEQMIANRLVTNPQFAPDNHQAELAEMYVREQTLCWAAQSARVHPAAA
jgi:hypothetical protein